VRLTQHCNGFVKIVKKTSSSGADNILKMKAVLNFRNSMPFASISYAAENDFKKISNSVSDKYEQLSPNSYLWKTFF